MTKFAALAAATLVMAGTLGAPQAQARGGGALAAGVIGGLAAGALLGAAISDAHAGPAYGYDRPAPAYGYGRPVPVYGYDRPAPVYGYDRPAAVYGYAPRPVRVDEEDFAPVYRSRGVVRTYETEPGYGDRPAGYGWHRHCDRPDGDRGW